TVEKLRDDPLLCAGKLWVAHFYAGIQPDYEVIEVEPEAGSSTDCQLPQEPVEFKFPSRVQLIFVDAPDVAEVGKRGRFQFGTEYIVHDFETVFHIAFELNLPQLVEITEIKA